MIAATWSDRALKRAGSIRQAPYSIITLIGAVLLFGFYRQRYYDATIWQVGRSTAWSMVGLATIGVAFTW
jgi:hypothetical protein